MRLIERETGWGTSRMWDLWMGGEMKLVLGLSGDGRNL